MDNFTKSYIACSLWAETVTVKDDKGEDLDINISDHYTIDDLAPATLGQMIADCAKFQVQHSVLLKSAYASGNPYNESKAGHDFWLTRCGHGAGFWDRGLDDIGKRLSDAASAYGNIDLYIGDDGLIYG